MLKLNLNKVNIFLLVLLISALVVVRAFENELFYDPFLDFFKDDYQNKKIPLFHQWPLFLSLSFRYFLNAIITVFVLHILFKDRAIVKLTSVLLFVFFIVLIGALFFLVNTCTTPDYLYIFYVRRFLIQPLFLILFVPAFYYQKCVNK